ncbi:protein translocase subunit SecD [Streptomyces lycii]|uniref:Multifunctional fusion protein n=1 Tax=Streptomyces lycii TaxID=2654337 RepID=A0ABQ7FPF6_9ACTN|nr:protein translocase subunit SecD [Streptomyces lycii]
MPASRWRPGACGPCLRASAGVRCVRSFGAGGVARLPCRRTAVPAGSRVRGPARTAPRYGSCAPRQAAHAPRHAHRASPSRRAAVRPRPADLLCAPHSGDDHRHFPPPCPGRARGEPAGGNSVPDREPDRTRARPSGRPRPKPSGRGRSRPGRGNVVRAVVALAVVALFLALTQSPRLGLDLRGGTQIVLETRDSPQAEADAEATDRTLEVLRRRIDALGVTEPGITRSGDNRIIVELPGVQDPREAEKVLGRTAQLSFHPVLGAGEPATERKDGEDGEDGAEKDEGRTLNDEDGRPLRLGPTRMTGEGVEGAEARFDSETGGGWFVSLDLKGAGGKEWQRLTGEAACAAPGDPARRVAIVLDDKVISSPQVDPSVRCEAGIAGGSTQITGSFGQQEAEELSLLISGGALPVPVETVEQRTVGPTLGAAAIEASAWAAVIGVALTSLFILFVYRLFGGLAAIALAAYGLISYAALVAVGATLTLPGLAGFVLAIGMAVDANVLVFERAREEYAARRTKSLRTALTSGYRNAFSAIADSNVTTLLAAVLLFFLASGPVRGFGVTLSIGVLASMVSALVVARALTGFAGDRTWVRRRPAVTGIAAVGRVRTWITRRSPDLMRHGRRWLAVSAAAVVLATSGIVVRGLDFGVEFTGGRLVEYATNRPVDAERAREAVSDAGFPRAVVQSSGEGDISVRTEELTNAEEARVREALAGPGGGAEKLRDELIGPSLGDELRRNALIALGVALLAQLGYLAVRFRWTFGIGAVAAMAHDVLILTGVFAWLGKPVDGVFLAALLTVIGYSVNDSVVVFDRVRELWARHRGTPFARVANTAVLQTVPRTVNTGTGAVFILAALALLGGDSLTDFALALLIGIVVGTYSSVFTATPMAVELEERCSERAIPVKRKDSATKPSAGGKKSVERQSGDNGAVV